MGLGGCGPALDEGDKRVTSHDVVEGTVGREQLRVRVRIATIDRVVVCRVRSLACRLPIILRPDHF
jgi:hypothetical protein